MFTRTTKLLVAALVLTGVSLSLVADASARHSHRSYNYWGGGQNYFMDRGGGGGGHAGDTNGGA